MEQHLQFSERLISHYSQSGKKMNESFSFKEDLCFLVNLIPFEKSFSFTQMLSYLYFISLVTVLLSA